MAALFASGLALAGAAPGSVPDPEAEAVAVTRLGPLAHRPRQGGKVTMRIAEPIVRIGLSGDGKTILLDSRGGLYVVDRESGRDVWRHIYKSPLRVVVDRDGVREPTAVFVVQVASLAAREAADDLAARLEAETGERAEVSRNPDRNSWRVRVGRRTSREEIAQVEERLRSLGFGETWVVEESIAGGRQPRMRLVDEEYNDMLTSSTALLALPAADGRPLLVDGQPYRGAVEVLVTRSARLKAVNIVNTEEYLRGVVPKELGPAVYPELEALKAQAVAARTYVEANRGQFGEDGYDICDTARCQVYGGISAEHPLSDLAVSQTRGVIALHEGRPINALYTSTCGGHTEDLKNVFREMEGPYLRGVPCYPDEEALALSRETLRGAEPGPPVLLPSGERIDAALSVLEILQVVPAQSRSPEIMGGAPTPSEIGGWTSRALAAAGKGLPKGFAADRAVDDLAGLAVYLVEALGWGDRLAILIDDRDLPSILGDAALGAAPEASRAALAYLVREGILTRASPAERLTRGVLARALHRLILRYESTGLQPAKYRGIRGSTIGLQHEGDLVFRPIAPRLHLVLKEGAESRPVSDHPVQDGDNLEYHLSSAGEVDYLLLKANQRSSSFDRYSGLYTWETRVSRADLESAIRDRASIGRLIDVTPGRRGASGRIVDLTVTGTSGRFTFRGFDIERLLGLRETLFLVDRQHARDGSVETFIFSGKGWGHGVGMCQVGAYGMALRGKTYEEILHHYYTGVTLGEMPPR